ncbi:MAG: hypothetical protein J6S75_03275 [Thermoguttaceae bacterium]|nr:hypothetical protein [Thermoguttaceae bacterium]
MKKFFALGLVALFVICCSFGCKPQDKQQIETDVQNVGADVKAGDVDQAKTDLAQTAEDVGTAVENAASDAADAVADAAGEAKDAVADAASDVKDAVTGADEAAPEADPAN